MKRRWREIPEPERDAIVAEARKLVGFLKWNTLAKRFNVDGETLRERCDPAFRQRQIEERRSRSHVERRRDRKSVRVVLEAGRIAPTTLAARLAEIPEDMRSPAARLLGDPLPGRSALERRVRS